MLAFAFRFLNLCIDRPIVSVRVSDIQCIFVLVLKRLAHLLHTRHRTLLRLLARLQTSALGMSPSRRSIASRARLTCPLLPSRCQFQQVSISRRRHVVLKIGRMMRTQDARLGGAFTSPKLAGLACMFFNNICLHSMNNS